MKMNDNCEISPIFKKGDYIQPVRKSIYCDFYEPGLIKSVNREREEYIVLTKNKSYRVSFFVQDYYRTVIPNKNQIVK